MPTPPPDIDDVLHDIPVEYRERFEGLLGHTTVPAASLHAEVVAYLETVRRVGPYVAFIDVAEAERLGRTALELIALLQPGQPPAVHVLVQAATRYFVLEDEDEEVTGVLGFDDDIQVVNAVSRALGRADLVMPLKHREV